MKRTCISSLLIIALFPPVLIFARQPVAGKLTADPMPYMYALAQNSKGYLFLGCSKGIYRSTDDGVTWRATGMQSGIPNAIAVDSRDNIYTAINISGLFKSVDNGQTWAEINSGIENKWLWALACSPKGTVIAAGDEIYRSTNGGDLWTRIRGLGYSDGARSLVASPAGVVVAGCLTGLWVSNDDGSSWLPNFGLPSRNAGAVAADSAGGLLSGGTGSGLCYSSDKGATWTQISPNPGGFLCAITVGRGGNIFVGFYMSGVESSTDGGKTWSFRSVGSNSSINCMIVTKTGAVLAGGYMGLYRSTDNGLTWLSSTEGLTAIGQMTSGVLLTFSLSQNYPNPFNPSTTISYELPEATNASLKIFNPLGQVVATLVDGRMNAGYHRVEWNASSVPSGIYFYRLLASPTDGGQTGEFVETKKMILLR
jgi:photosystem II stability/assembly factor-like uncharacterized protein